MKLLDWLPDMVRFMKDASEYSDYNQILTDEIRKCIPTESCVCDAGCGLGYLALHLAPYVKRVTAIDQNKEALRVLDENCKTRKISNVDICCGDIHMLQPPQPYDAMVFCFFGKIDEILKISQQQCKGDVFVITRNYEYHRFSVAQHAHQRESYQMYCDTLKEKGIPFKGKELDLEFGQPLRNLEDARLFYRLYSADEDLSVITDEFLLSRLQCTGRTDFPYYLPHKRKIGLLHWTVANIPQ